MRVVSKTYRVPISIGGSLAEAPPQKATLQWRDFHLQARMNQQCTILGLLSAGRVVGVQGWLGLLNKLA